MNISGFMKKFGKTLSDAAGNVADAVGAGLGTLDGYIGKTVSEKAGRKIYSKAADILSDEAVQGTSRKIAQNLVNGGNSFRLGNAIGAGTEGLLVGSAGGAVIGGIAGGVDEDETFIGGAVKGALVGGALGGIGGGIGGAIHNNAGLMENISNDAISVSKRILKWGVGVKDSMSIKDNVAIKDGMATLFGDLQ